MRQMTTRLRSSVCSFAACGLAAISLAGAASAQTAQAGRPLTAQLTGPAEAPKPGDPDGAGEASVRVNPGQNQVCYELSVSNIDAATMAHIHKAPAGEAGPPVVTLTPPGSGSSTGCATVTRDLAQDLIQNPQAYYVNVHNAAFPSGAVRGQLTK
jgi:hypothetical protein